MKLADDKKRNCRARTFPGLQSPPIVTSKHGSHAVFPARIASSTSVVMYDDENDEPFVSAVTSTLTNMRAFAEKWGLMEKLAGGHAEFEDAVVAARPPQRQVNLEFAACLQIKLVCVCV